MSDNLKPRPAPWAPPIKGFHYEAVEEDSDWITPPIGAGRCRYTSGHPLHGCGAPSVATVLRGASRRAYDYCGEHLYGRWVEDGKVMHWRLVKDDA